MTEQRLVKERTHKRDSILKFCKENVFEILLENIGKDVLLSRPEHMAKGRREDVCTCVCGRGFVYPYSSRWVRRYVIFNVLN
jgi:hypothetical protein